MKDQYVEDIEKSLELRRWQLWRPTRCRGLFVAAKIKGSRNSPASISDDRYPDLNDGKRWCAERYTFWFTFSFF